MSRWLTHWGLTEAPFTKEIGDADLWVPASRKPSVERLVDTCRERGHAVLWVSRASARRACSGLCGTACPRAAFV